MIFDGAIVTSEVSKMVSKGPSASFELVHLLAKRLSASFYALRSRVDLVTRVEMVHHVTRVAVVKVLSASFDALRSHYLVTRVVLKMVERTGRDLVTLRWVLIRASKGLSASSVPLIV